MEERSENAIMEEREGAMVSPFSGRPTLRKAHFLKPTISTSSNLPSPPSKAPIIDARETPLKVIFRTNSYPNQDWKEWVHKLLPKYQNTWKRSGIYDSIISSTYPIIRQKDLILALAERWSIETNTFVFPWGECTITLEDIVVLGGYSVLGESVLSPRSTSSEKAVKMNKLMKAFRSKKLHKGQQPTQISWMKYFMGKNSSIEHEAFLVFWLSKYALCTGHGCITPTVLSLAIHLSEGTRLALAPAILSALYQDLGMLKNSIVSSSLIIYLWAPLHLVQVWAWERFLTLRPNPKPIQVKEPRLARWRDIDVMKMNDLREVIDSAGQDFQWRPYCITVNNWKFNEFYKSNEEQIPDKEMETFAMFIRPSELVGFGGCIQQYLPHRVAMQFGMDQDIPDFVPRTNDCSELAWINYKRPIGDEKVYIAHRLFESDVTVRYLAWWDPKKSGLLGFKEGFSPLDSESRASKSGEILMDPLSLTGNGGNPNSCSPLNNNNENGNSGRGEEDFLDSKLEDRISRLEKLVVMIKHKFFS